MAIKRTQTVTCSTSGGTQYTFEVDFCMGGSISSQLYTEEYMYNTDNRYTEHGFNVSFNLRIKNSSGNYIYPSMISHLKMRLKLGYDVFECDLNGKKIWYSDSGGYYWVAVYFDKDVYRAYTPGSATRANDSFELEFISDDQVNYPYGKTTGTITYPPYYQASIPTTNYAIVGINNTLTIYTNRTNNNMTHTITYSIYGNNKYMIWDTTMFEYTHGTRTSNSTYNTLATGVGDSYNWNIPVSVFYNSSVSDGFYDLVIRVETFYNGVSLGSRTVVVKLQKNTTQSYENAAFNYLQIHDSGVTGQNYSRKHFVAGKSRLYFSGHAKWVPKSGQSYSSGYLWDVRYTIDGTTMFDYDVERSTASSFTTNTNTLNLSSVQYDVSWGNYRYKPGIRDLPLGVEAHYTRSGDSSYSTALNTTSVDYYISSYSSPSISTLNVYRVDSNGNRDSDGEYLHIKCDCSNKYLGGGGDGDNQSIFDINSIKLVMQYKKLSDTSWSSITLVPVKYENYIMYDQMYTGVTFDPTSIYEFKFDLSDKFETVSRSVTLRPPIILMDYNKSGTALAFGKISDAPAGASYIETIFPIIFEDTANRVSSIDNGITGAITQIGTNSSGYYHIFVGRSTTGYRRYGISIYDNDSVSDDFMRFSVGSSYLDIKYTTMRYYNYNAGYYFETNPTSTYCNINTSSSYFYFNKSIYVNGNLLATQSWVSNNYASQTYVDNAVSNHEKKSISGNNHDYSGTGTTSNSSYVKIPLGATSDGGTTSNKLLICWGEDYFSSWNKGGTTKTINFPASYYWYPVVMVCPRGVHNFNYPHLSAYSNGGSNFTAVLGDSATIWCENIYTDNSSGDGYWGRVRSYRDTSKFTSTSFSFNWVAIGLASS